MLLTCVAYAHLPIKSEESTTVNKEVYTVIKMQPLVPHSLADPDPENKVIYRLVHETKYLTCMTHAISLRQKLKAYLVLTIPRTRLKLFIFIVYS